MHIIHVIDYASFGTIPARKSHNLKQILIICVANADSVLDIGYCKIFNVLASPMIRSICTLLLAILRSLITVSPESRFFS